MRDPSKQSEAEFDATIARLGASAAVIGDNPRLAYESEIFAMVRRVRREANREQIARIREHVRNHPGQDHRPFINHIMGWEQLL